MNQSIDQLNLFILNVGFAIHNADWNWENVKSPFTRLYYVTDGSAMIILPTGVQVLKPNHMYLVPPFTSHSYSCDSLFSHYYIHIYEDHLSECSILEHYNFPVEIDANEWDLSLIKRLCNINPCLQLKESDPKSYDNNPSLIEGIIKNNQLSFCHKVESRGIIYMLLSHFLKDARLKTEVNDNRIQKAISYIRKNIHKSMTTETLADISYMSKDHFIRLFKKEVNTTPLQYINQEKIKRAQLILITDNMPVKSIAFLLAFEDYSYFTRLFKKMTGITPKQYREMYNAVQRT